MSKLELIKENERLDDLEYNGLKLIQNPNWYCFSSDAVLLANFVKAKSQDIVVEFGLGNGVISILIAGKTNAKKIIGFEIQANTADLANRNIMFNNLQDRIEVLNNDFKEASSILGKETVNIVVANPPYFSVDSGMKSEFKERAISRQETTCTLEEMIKNASEILKYSGKMYMIHKTERMAEVIASMVNNKLEPKKITLIYPKQNKKADTFIIEAQKMGKPGLIINSLIVYEKNGTMTTEAKKLYGKA